MVEVNHLFLQNQTQKEWKIRIEGKIMGAETEQELLEGPQVKRFLNFFEKVQIEFPGGEYPPVEWVKSKSEVGSSFDCIEIRRNFLKENSQRQ